MFDLKFAALFRENKTSFSASVFMQNLVANFILFFASSASHSHKIFMFKSNTDEQNGRKILKEK